MGSWIRCICGDLVHTNLFAGEKVCRLIKDSDYDAIEDPVDRDKLSDLFFERGIPVYQCNTCGRLLVEWDEEGGSTFYLPEGRRAETPGRETTVTESDQDEFV